MCKNVVKIVGMWKLFCIFPSLLSGPSARSWIGSNDKFAHPFLSEIHNTMDKEYDKVMAIDRKVGGVYNFRLGETLV